MRRHRVSRIGAGLAFLAVSGIGMIGWAGVASAAPSVTVTPTTKLDTGSVVKVTGSGFTKSTGTIIECNTTGLIKTGKLTLTHETTQPRITFDKLIAAPVSCSDPLTALLTPGTTGKIAKTFTIRTGTVGPPTTGKDTSTGTAAVDAAKFPCPPTNAQRLAGAVCVLVIETTKNETVAPVVLKFATTKTTTTTTSSTTTTTSAHSTTTTTTAAATTTTRAGGTPTTTAPAVTTTTAHTAASTSSGSSGSSGTGSNLAFTGPGPGVWMTAIGGLLLLDLGFLVLTLYYRPRDILALAGRGVTRLFGGR